MNTSVSAHIGMAGSSVYAASKAGLISLVRTLLPDLLPRGIRINALSPRPVDAPLYAKLGFPPEQMTAFADGVRAKVPLRASGHRRVLLMISGAAITISLLYATRLHDHGLHAGAVTAVRFLGIIALAAGVLGIGGRTPGIGDVGATTLAVAAGAVIVLPVFILQMGIARTGPMTAQIIRSLGPVCVFALEQLDRRLTYSAPVLACIVVYSASVVAANIAHGWRGRSPDGALARSPRTS